MASDKQQFDRMEAHRGRLLAEGKLSHPQETGYAAIFVVYDADFADRTKHADSLAAMCAEALRVRRYLQLRGRATSYFPEATVEDLWTALDDITVSDLIVIGIAQLSKLHIAPWSRASTPSKQYRMVSYFDAISHDGAWPTIDHLKQGSFYQRTSGGMFETALNIPFSWGFMANRAKIWGVPQFAFHPNRWHTRPQAGLLNVGDFFGLAESELNERMSYVRAKELFATRKRIKTRPHLVPQFAYPFYERMRYSEQGDWLHKNIRRLTSSTT
jgi:hypothetical protein